MTFERTFDIPTIKSIVTRPSVWMLCCDDFSPMPMEWEPCMDEQILYVLVRDGDELLGMWIFHPTDSRIVMKVHTCLLPEGRGKKGYQAAKEMAVWFWENTQAERLITDVPACHPRAVQFALAAGMTKFGVNPQSFKKNGRLWDVILLGMSRAENMAGASPDSASDAIRCVHTGGHPAGFEPTTSGPERIITCP